MHWKPSRRGFVGLVLSGAMAMCLKACTTVETDSKPTPAKKVAKTQPREIQRPPVGPQSWQQLGG